MKTVLLILMGGACLAALVAYACGWIASTFDAHFETLEEDEEK